MGAGVAKTREPKSVTAGIWWRGQWDVVGDRGNKGALEVEIVEDAVVYASESLKFKLEVLCLEPLEESNFIVVQEGSLKDVSDPLTLLCVCRWVIDVAGNGGLSVRYVGDVCITTWVLVPPRCSTRLSVGPVLCRTHDTRHPGTICGVTTASGWRLLVYLHTDAGTTL